jgi:hypothetical protein
VKDGLRRKITHSDQLCGGGDLGSPQSLHPNIYKHINTGLCVHGGHLKAISKGEETRAHGSSFVVGTTLTLLTQPTTANFARSPAYIPPQNRLLQHHHHQFPNIIIDASSLRDSLAFWCSIYLRIIISSIVSSDFVLILVIITNRVSCLTIFLHSSLVC